MKKLLSLLLMSGVFLLLAFPAYAQGTEVASGTCGAEGNGSNITWVLDDEGTLTIVGSGEMENYTSDSSAPWNSYRSDINEVVIEVEYNRMSIGNFAFAYCDNLTKVTIPKSLESIGNSAFEHCSSLTGLTIPGGATSIGNFAFAQCDSLEEIIMPGSVTSIGYYAFGFCDNLTKITIPMGVTSIGWATFNGCSSLTEIIIPSSVTNIGNGAFNNCSSLTDIYYGGTQEKWSEIAVNNNNDALASATIHYTSGTCGAEGDGSNVTWVLDGDGTLTISGTGKMHVYAFLEGGDPNLAVCPWVDECENITKVVIEEGITAIGDGAFAGCSNLTDVLIPDSVTDLGWDPFAGCSSLTHIDIPEGVTGINAFGNCTGLTEITIPSSATYIGEYAFFGCSNLKKVEIRNGLTKIWYEAFENCTSLTEIWIPVSVTEIDGWAFVGCNELSDVYYGGNKAQWEAIQGLKDNPELLAATIHYADGTTSTGSGTGTGSGSGSGSGGSGSGGGGCYVATAVYGSYDCPEVWTLRRYRDYELSQTAAGRAFIRTYYAVSPTIVEHFGDEEWFQDMWRGPLDKMVSNLQAKGYESTPYEDIAW